MHQSSTAIPRDNNFNLIRMIAASMVLVSHSYVLSTGEGSSEPMRLSLGVTWGSIAVDIFFVTSGYLISASLLTKKDLVEFTVARTLRIFPGLAAALLLTIVVCGFFFSALPLGAYLTEPQTARYLLKNLIMFKGNEWALPGVFQSVPTAESDHGGPVNGSLWTLYRELQMYALLAVLFKALDHLGRHLPRRWAGPDTARRALIAFGLMALLYSLITNLDHREHEISGLLAMFFAGTALYGLGRHIPFRWPIFLCLAGAVAAASLWATPKIFGVIYTLALPYIVLFLAFVPGGAIRRFNQLGDYSYGTYIYAFPIQQMVAASIPGVTPWTMTLLALPSVLSVAAASWHWVEEPMLRKKRAAAKRLSDLLTAQRRRVA